jgi:hypothetical protein
MKGDKETLFGGDEERLFENLTPGRQFATPYDYKIPAMQQ